VTLRIDHPAVTESTELAPDVRMSLAEDLAH
jgi:hypothetical protein